MSENKQKKVSVARYLVSRIEDLGVEVVPVIQGGVIMKMIDEVGESKKLRYICPNHEQALAMMVDTYARIRGFGVGMATSGPGGVNLATGIACAYYDSIPCLFITGQVGMFHVTGDRKVRQRGFQETNMVRALGEVTKYAKLIEKAEDARFIFEEAVYTATSGRPGPVVIDLPYNVQREMVDPAELRAFIPPREEENKKNIKKARRVVEEIYRAKKPLLLAGGGVRVSNQGEEIRKFVQETEIPVVTTWGAADVLGHDNPLHLGNVGKSGNPSAVHAVQECDLLVCLGTRFTPKIVIDEKKFAKHTRVIAIDIDKAELEEGIIIPEETIQGDLRTLIPAMRQETKGRKVDQEEWKLYLREKKKREYHMDGTRKGSVGYVSPYDLTEILFEEAPDNTVFLPDAGANLIWVMQASKPKEGQRIISAWGNSPMGYSFPAGLGVRLADPDVPVIALIGDGGFQMNIQELQTMVGNKLDIKIFVLNNKSYGNIVIGARREFNGRVHGNTADAGYTTPDFIKVAEAYGIPTKTLRANDSLREKVQEILKKKGPLLIDVDIDPEQEHIETLL